MSKPIKRQLPPELLKRIAIQELLIDAFPDNEDMKRELFSLFSNELFAKYTDLYERTLRIRAFI